MRGLRAERVGLQHPSVPTEDEGQQRRITLPRVLDADFDKGLHRCAGFLENPQEDAVFAVLREHLKLGAGTGGKRFA